MAYTISRNSNKVAYGIKELIFNTVMEMFAYPTQRLTPGSTAIITDASQIYILNNNHQWKLWVCEGGGGGGDTDPDVYNGGDISDPTSGSEDTYIWDGQDIGDNPPPNNNSSSSETGNGEGDYTYVWDGKDIGG